MKFVSWSQSWVIEANKDSLYTLEELKAAYAAARKQWNEGKHPATGERRIDMYNNSVNEETPEVTVHDMVDMFWVFAKRMATFTDAGLQITIKGQKRQYEVFDMPGVPDHEWRRPAELLNLHRGLQVGG